MVLSETSKNAKPSVSIVVLAFNEAKNLETTIASIQKAIASKFPEYEIIVVNDGSNDNTGKVAETLAEQDSHLRVIHNKHNMGCGFTFLRGAKAARYQYAWLIPGDGEIPTESIETIASHIGTANMVIPYVLNFRIRPLSRRIISWGYTALLNGIFLKRLRYYNGPCVIRCDLVRTAPTVNSRGFTFMAPILLRLIKQKHTYVEVGIMLQPRHYGSSSVSSLWNILSAIKTVCWLLWDINVAQHLRSARTSCLS